MNRSGLLRFILHPLAFFHSFSLWALCLCGKTAFPAFLRVLRDLRVQKGMRRVETGSLRAFQGLFFSGRRFAWLSTTGGVVWASFE